MSGRCRLALVLLIAVTACEPDSVLPDEDLPLPEPDPASFDIDLDELDDLARDHLVEVQALSITEAVEYCGLYGYGSNGELVATPGGKSVKITAPFEGIVIGATQNPLVNQGDGIFHIAATELAAV